MSDRVLIAGIGNMFLGDDGFGVELARKLSRVELGDDVVVADYGTSGMHLAYDLTEDYDRAILLDAMARGEEPGTLTVLEIDPDAPDFAGTSPDAHGMQPDAVLGLLSRLGGRIEKLYLIGCEPADLDDRMGLSAPVAAALDDAVPLVIDLVTRLRGTAALATVPTAPTTEKRE
ncbi:MAG: hydrogenase maturation protease [Sciscionella sp.]